MDELEIKLTELIAAYPNRWQQAVANPNLYGWFVNKMTGAGSSAVSRALALKIVERRASA